MPVMDRDPHTDQETGPETNHDNSTANGDSPYAVAWRHYVDIGWRGVLPIRRTFKGKPSNGKFPPPAGYTGREHWDTYPSVEQMQAWVEDTAQWGNIVLRVPDTVLGLDVDNYGDKHGARSLYAMRERHGDPGATWSSGNRPDDKLSRIWWYRVPSGLAWDGAELEDVDLIRHGHRYGLVWPSVHPSGRMYRWWQPNGQESDRPPAEHELTELLLTWVAALTRGKRDDNSPRQGVVVDERMGDARLWLTRGVPCQAVDNELSKYTGSNRHDTIIRRQVALLRLGEQGHRGVQAAIDTLECLFLDDVTADGSRSQALAADEFQRGLNGAPKEIKGRTHPAQRGCCRIAYQGGDAA